MRKSVLPRPSSAESQLPENDPKGFWLDLEELARVELSSEDTQHPFEHALQAGDHDGWRAAEPGPQTIRLHFDTPQSIRHIQVSFQEDKVSRSQEFALFATSQNYPRKEIVRQQWTFSPGHSSHEKEDFVVNLPGVTLLEIEIDPGRHDKQVVASLQRIAISSRERA